MKIQFCNSIRRTIIIKLAGILLVIFFFTFSGCHSPVIQKENSSWVQPYHANQAFWQYEGKPVLLLGASSDHNIFQHDTISLNEELDKLLENGGNYLRNTLSFRAPEEEVFAFFQDPETKLFDLEKFNDQYWAKLSWFLKATYKRNIIVQLEVWETYDFYSRLSHVRDGKTAWERNPFNPANNVNYDYWASGLPELFQSNGQALINPFFNTVIPLEEPFDFSISHAVLYYQQRFVDKLLSVTMPFDHVLYCINNETQADPKWSLYWAQYLRYKAEGEGNSIEITDMFDPFDPSGGKVEGAIMQSPEAHFFTSRSNVGVTLNNPEWFSFIDISNHNAQSGEVHYNTGLYVWNQVQASGVIRPVNNVKIYGAQNGTWNGLAEEGKQRFWRNIFAGAASVRFHRPPSGLGNSDIALAHMKSMRMITDSIWFFDAKPSNQLLENRDENEAYCLANPSHEILVYFPDGGDVKVNAPKGKYNVRWLDIEKSTWTDEKEMSLPGEIVTPAKGHWAVCIRPV